MCEMVCHALRLLYLKNLQPRRDPRGCALKLSQLCKLGETIPFETLCLCIIHGDTAVRNHLLRFCRADLALVAALGTGCNLSLSCLNMYVKDEIKHT